MQAESMENIEVQSAARPAEQLTFEVITFGGNVVLRGPVTPTLTVWSVKNQLEVVTSWDSFTLDLLHGTQILADNALVSELVQDHATVVSLRLVRSHAEVRVTIARVDEPDADGLRDPLHRSLQVRSDTTIQELLDSAAAQSAMPASRMELFVRTEDFSNELQARMQAVRHAADALRRADFRNMARFAEVLRDAADDLVHAATGRGRGF